MRKADELIAGGASWAETQAELADRADIILTILTDERAVEQIYLGERGLLAGAVEGKLFIEMSTIRTSTINTIGAQITARGARLLDAPSRRTVEPARQGQLLDHGGGEAADLERARPAIESFSRKIVHMGPSGAGTTMKLALNMPMAIFWAGLSEAMAMGQQFGLNIAQMLDIYLDSPVAPCRSCVARRRCCSARRTRWPLMSPACARICWRWSAPHRTSACQRRPAQPPWRSSPPRQRLATVSATWPLSSSNGRASAQNISDRPLTIEDRDRGSRIEDRGSRIEDRGSRIEDRG